MSVLLGKGDGTFGAATNYATPAAPQSLAVGDFNGDGKLDLALAGGEFASAEVILWGAGDGTFNQLSTYNVGAYPVSVVAADFNLDGAPDLAVSNLFGASVSILLNLK